MQAVLTKKAEEQKSSQATHATPETSVSAEHGLGASSGIPLFLQAKLAVSQPDDLYEQEADRVAEQVMQMPGPVVQRRCVACAAGGPPCPACEKEQITVSRKAEGGTVGGAPSSVHSVLRSSGQPLTASARAFFEPRFGQDFSQVRVHTDREAQQSARDVNSLAYTVGSHVVFGVGHYAPGTSDGQRLLAHELTHVVQGAGRSSDRSVRRTVAANSVCTPNVHNAPANPLDELRLVDALAQDMALGASNVLFLEALTFRDPVFGRSEVFDAYRDWFGLPQQTASGAWRSRFRTATFATEDEAVQHELMTLSDRFKRIHGWLAQDIRYRCPGTGSYTIPGCSAGPCGSKAAQTCPTGSRTVGICPNFWVEPAPQDRAQAALLIHEAIHPLFHFRHHVTASVSGRGRNPGCYQGFIHAIFHTGLLPADCTIAP